MKKRIDPELIIVFGNMIPGMTGKFINYKYKDAFSKKGCYEALHFINEEASDIEVYWFSEVLCEIYDATLDSRFIKAIENRANQMNDVEMKRSIIQEINHI